MSLKDRYYDLNDESIFGNSHDPRARQLKQQTKCLMNSLTTMSKQARVNATCRRRVVENSQEIGEDHVVEVRRYLNYDLPLLGSPLIDFFQEILVILVKVVQYTRQLWNR